MALEMNVVSFDAFVNFAETQHTAGKDKAVARFEKPDADGLST